MTTGGGQEGTEDLKPCANPQHETPLNLDVTSVANPGAQCPSTNLRCRSFHCANLLLPFPRVLSRVCSVQTHQYQVVSTLSKLDPKASIHPEVPSWALQGEFPVPDRKPITMDFKAWFMMFYVKNRPPRFTLRRQPLLADHRGACWAVCAHRETRPQESEGGEASAVSTFSLAESRQLDSLAPRRMAMTEIRTFPQGAPLRELTPCAAENHTVS